VDRGGGEEGIEMKGVGEYLFVNFLLYFDDFYLFFRSATKERTFGETATLFLEGVKPKLPPTVQPYVDKAAPIIAKVRSNSSSPFHSLNHFISFIDR
jgi:hypothetical protein